MKSLFLQKGGCSCIKPCKNVNHRKAKIAKIIKDMRPCTKNNLKRAIKNVLILLIMPMGMVCMEGSGQNR